MSTKVILTCDRCSDSWERDSPESKEAGKQIWTVGMGISHGTNQSIHAQDKAEWCRKCVVETGLLDASYVYKNNVTVKIEPRPTFEERVTELIEELGFQLTND